MQTGTATMENSMEVFKPKNRVTIRSCNPTPGYISRENYNSKRYTHLIAALFTIAESWNQPICLLTDKWIKRIWYIYTMQYYSAIKKNTIGSFVETWMELETVIQSEVSQKEKNIVY